MRSGLAPWPRGTWPATLGGRRPLWPCVQGPAWEPEIPLCVRLFEVQMRRGIPGTAAWAPLTAPCPSPTTHLPPLKTGQVSMLLPSLRDSGFWKN